MLDTIDPGAALPRRGDLAHRPRQRRAQNGRRPRPLCADRVAAPLLGLLGTLLGVLDHVKRVHAEALEDDAARDLALAVQLGEAAEDLEGRFTDTPRDRFWLAVDVSAYSLVACARAAEPLASSESKIA